MGIAAGMTSYGSTLMGELHDPRTLVRSYADAGFERVALVDVSDDQEGFLRFWTDELRPQLP